MLSTSDIPFMALTDVAAGIKEGTVSPVTLTETMLARIASVDPELHSFIAVTADEATAQARQAESEIRSGRDRGPRHGVPIAIKDLFFTKGSPATFGSMAYKDFTSDYTATIVERLIAAGAVILGRLALHEGALAEHHPGGVEGAHGLEHLGLCLSQGDRVDTPGWLHCDETEHLTQVSGDHVAEAARRFVEAAAVLDGELLGNIDLHRLQILTVPGGFDESVGKAQGQNILHRLLSEEVIDPVDLIFVGDLLECCIQFT